MSPFSGIGKTSPRTSLPPRPTGFMRAPSRYGTSKGVLHLVSLNNLAGLHPLFQNSVLKPSPSNPLYDSGRFEICHMFKPHTFWTCGSEFPQQAMRISGPGRAYTCGPRNTRSVSWMMDKAMGWQRCSLPTRQTLQAGCCPH